MTAKPEVKAKPTAEERAAKKQEREKKLAAERAIAEAEAARLDADFALIRHQVWTGLYALALQLWVLKQENNLEDNTWWFEDFGVDVIPGHEGFSIENSGGRTIRSISFETLSRENHERIEASLKLGFELREQEIEARLAAERERIRLAGVREAALGKLSDEEKKVLGIR